MNEWWSPGEVRHQTLQLPVQPFPIKKSGETYAKVIIPDGISQRDFGENQHVPHIDSGVDIAKDLVRGKEGMGVFVAAGDEPTDEEIAKAREEMLTYFREQVSEGDSLWARTQDPKKITMHMRVAVKALGIKRDWATDLSQLVQCVACSELIAPTAVKCPRCGAVRDWERARVLGLVSQEQYDFATGATKTAEPAKVRGNPNWIKAKQEREAREAAEK